MSGVARTKGGLFRFRVLKGARKFICLLLWLLSIAFGSLFFLFFFLIWWWKCWAKRAGQHLAIIIDGCFQYLIILRIRHVARFLLADFTVEAAEAVAASLSSSACWRNNQQLYYECTNTGKTVVVVIFLL